MKREHLEHVLREASRIVNEPDVLVIGSQSILGEVRESDLPDAATASMEVDVAFFEDPDDEKADLVDATIGELSTFHETYGYYAQGVSTSTAVLPAGWRDRVVVLATTRSSPGHGHCLERHDCVVSKLVAGREKDLVFASALLEAGLIDLDVLAERAETIDAHPLVIDRIRGWITSQRGS